MGSSITGRTKELLKKMGYDVHIVERWNQFAGVRQDAFGFADILAFKPSVVGAMLVQCTSDANHAARRNKVEGIAVARRWLQAGNTIVVVSWRKKMQGRIGRWVFRAEAATISNGSLVWSPVWENLVSNQLTLAEPAYEEVPF
jgi:hypothetical protein